jgi:hypothetical protein
MRLAVLTLALLLQASPVLAAGGCPNTCPEGMVRSIDTGECVPITPMV